jgi:hypothetical protein
VDEVMGRKLARSVSFAGVRVAGADGGASSVGATTVAARVRRNAAKSRRIRERNSASFASAKDECKGSRRMLALGATRLEIF